MRNRDLILLVEDNPINVAHILLEIGNVYNFITTDTAKLAIELVKTFDEIKIVLMDIKLDKDMAKLDGVYAMKEIRKFRPNLPVIAQTAYYKEYEYIELGFDDVIYKPYNKMLLIDKIKTNIK